MRLQTEGRKAGLDAVIACDRDGRLRLEILDWLNHVLFLAIFNQDGFLTYSPSGNEYKQGPDDAEKIREMLGIPLTGKELTALAMGDPFFLPLADPTVRISVDRDVLLLDVEAAGAGPRYLVWLDQEGRPDRMFVLRPYGGGQALGDLQVDYGRYRRVDSVSFPHRIRLKATATGSVLQVDYQRVVLNETLEEDLFRFSPPGRDTTE